MIFSKRWRTSTKDPPSLPGDQGGDPKPPDPASLPGEPPDPAKRPVKNHLTKTLMAMTAQSPPKAKTGGAPSATGEPRGPSQ